MDKLDAMNVFVKVASLGSFAAAGRALGLTRSATSKAVMELEHLLGARLLDRTTRSVAPTEAGRAYLESCLDVLARVAENEAQVSRMHSEPRGILKVNAPMSFGIRYLGRAVADFMTRYGEVKVELALTDRFINPADEGADVTIRIAELADSSLVAKKLAPARRVFVASPAYLEEFGLPRGPEDLARHRVVNYGHTTTLQRWQFIRDGKKINVPVDAVLCSNNGDVLLDAILCGQGIGELPTFLVGPEIRAGRLSLVLEGHEKAPLGIYALYTPNRYLAAKSRVFIDFLQQRFGESPAWDDFDSRWTDAKNM